MSPTAFKSQVTTLISLLHDCHDLCNDIRANRRLGSSTTALDELQSCLLSSANSISIQFSSLRKFLGSRLDLGDDLSRNTLNRCIREVQSTIETRLSDIANKRNEGQKPHFRELARKWEAVEYTVIGTLNGLSERLELSKPSTKPAAPTTPAPEKVRPRADEAIVSLKELDHLIAHMKNSWVEKIREGRVVYVNVFDEKKIVSERPGGFVQGLRRREDMYEREDVWRDSRGW